MSPNYFQKMAVKYFNHNGLLIRLKEENIGNYVHLTSKESKEKVMVMPPKHRLWKANVNIVSFSVQSKFYFLFERT